MRLGSPPDLTRNPEFTNIILAGRYMRYRMQHTATVGIIRDHDIEVVAIQRPLHTASINWPALPRKLDVLLAEQEAESVLRR